MNVEKLQNDLDEKKYTDVRIVLFDRKGESEMHLHKVVLGLASEYFDKMFNSGVGYVDEKNIRIEVEDKEIAQKVILKIYQIDYEIEHMPKWETKLRSIKLKDYWQMENDINELYKIDVPCEGFELLLETSSIFDMNKELIKTIKRNIPEDYPLENFSPEMIDQMRLNIDLRIICKPRTLLTSWALYPSEYSSSNIIGTIHNSIEMYDMNNNYIHTFQSDEDILDTIISSDGSKLAYNTVHSIIIHDLCKIKSPSFIIRTDQFISKSLAFSSKARLIASISGINIIIWDCSSGMLLQTIITDKTNIFWNNVIPYTNYKTCDLIFSPDDSKLLYYKNVVKIFNVSTGDLLCTIDISIYKIIFTPNSNKILVIGLDNHFRIWDANAGNLIKDINNDKYVNVAVSPDGKKIITVSNHKIDVWDGDMCKILKTIEATYLIRDIAFMDNVKIYVIGTSIKIYDTITGILLNEMRITIKSSPTYFLSHIDHRLKDYVTNQKQYEMNCINAFRIG